MPSNFFLWLNSVFVGNRHEIVLQVKYFKKLSTELNEQGLELKFITLPFYIEIKLF